MTQDPDPIVLIPMLRRTTMKKVIALSFALLMTAGALAGCNTIQGAGEDVERGGEAVQDAAS